MTITLHKTGLPEHTDFKDTGCDIHPFCLTCPRPLCRYDEPDLYSLRRRKERTTDRRAEAVRLRVTLGLSAEEAAAHMGVTERSVHRLLAGAR